MEWPTWALDAWEKVAPWAERAAVWRGYENELRTLLIYGIGIAVYTALVFLFYQSLSKREGYHSKRKPGFWGGTLHYLESALVFPALSFAYFLVIALALFLLTKPLDALAPLEAHQSQVSGLLLVAMAVVVSVRVTVWISEAMSNDLAKLVPLSFLAVVLVDPGYLQMSTFWGRIGLAAGMLPLLGRYFLLFIVLDGVLKVTHHAVRGIGRRTAARAHRPPKVKELLHEVEEVHEANPPLRSVPVKEVTTAREGPAAEREPGFVEVK